MLLRVLKWFFQVEAHPLVPQAPEVAVDKDASNGRRLDLPKLLKLPTTAPDATAQFEEWMHSYRHHPRYLELQLSASTTGARVYAVTLKNVSDQPIYSVAVHYGPLLHPGKFGLDDTHMPTNMWVLPPLMVAEVQAGDSATFDVVGYDVHEMYDGSSHCNVKVCLFVGSTCGKPVEEPMHPVRVLLPNAQKTDMNGLNPMELRRELEAIWAVDGQSWTIDEAELDRSDTESKIQDTKVGKL
jgi:hypothetical protein